MNREPLVTVGIMFEPQIEIIFNAPYHFNGEKVEGRHTVSYNNGKISWNDQLFDELLFEASHDATFTLKDVTIGINFHWERKEDQRFEGALKLIVEDEKITAINIIGVEEYLLSVISSEMNAESSEGLLKAHAVISRSWLLAQIEKNREIKSSSASYTSFMEREGELIKWYDREDHTNFDVCADDHCQRYQGVIRATTDKVTEAVSQTRGEVLRYQGKICDARFSKCCGGVVEEFQYAWEDIKYPYLVALRDNDPEYPIPDLTNEEEAVKWILSSHQAYCNSDDKEVLSQVLNNYDQETTNFYRWEKVYGNDELSKLILERSGIDFGHIIDMIPVARGTSGRLYKLKIVGTKKTLVIGKELEIRRTLSTSHLYSSAFVIFKEGETKTSSGETVPATFTLKGAGWGHGVGLCQIGAAVMGSKGIPYDRILLHYFVGASIDKLY